MNEVEQALKNHYQAHKLQGSQVDAILEFCEPARQISRWKRLTFAGFGAAAAAVVALLLVVAKQSSQPPAPNANDAVTLNELRQPERFQLIAVKIHADPCGRCRKIAPVFADLQNEFSDDPVLFLTFDLTSEGSRRQAEVLSRTFGIEEVFEEHRYTGVIVLATPDGHVRKVVDSETGLTVAAEILSRNLSSG